MILGVFLFSILLCSPDIDKCSDKKFRNGHHTYRFQCDSANQIEM